MVRVRRVGLLAGGIVALALAWGPAAASASPTRCRIDEGQKICLRVADSPDPVSYSTFDNNATFLSYKATVTNRSASRSLDDVTLSANLPPRASFARGTAKGGKCTGSGTSARCPIGTLKAGGQTSVTLTIRAPSTSDANPPPARFASTLKAYFRPFDFSGGHPDKPGETTVTRREYTHVSKSAGQTYIPKGDSAQVDTDPTKAQYANVAVTKAATSLLATMDVLPPDNFCLFGQVTIQGQLYACRSGSWVNASVTSANTGTEYFNPQNPLVFNLRWAANLVSSFQTSDNFVVFYQRTASAPIQVISARCNATLSNIPCLRNITHAADGSWSVDLVKASNGHMR